MKPTLVAYVQAEIDGEGSITTNKRYNCQIAGAGVGIYDITIGQGGVDDPRMSASIVPRTALPGGAGTTRSPVLSSTSDTVKRVQFYNDAGALADPTGFVIAINRYPASIQ